MKKTTLIMIASASMLFAVPAMDTDMNMQGKKQNCKYKSSKMGQGMQCDKMTKKKKMSKHKRNSPSLIKHGLPHLSKMIMPYMNDPSFNLTADQKERLIKVRVNTMGVIMQSKQKVTALRKEIVNASTSGTNAADLKDKVTELALLQGTATMAHLKCIEETKAILTKDQLLYLLANKNKSKRHGKKGTIYRGHKSTMKNAKCKMSNK